MQAGSGRFSMHFDGVHLDLYATDYVWDCFTGHGWRRTGSAMVLDLPGMSRMRVLSRAYAIPAHELVLAVPRAADSMRLLCKSQGFRLPTPATNHD
jgi:hypothetical protein